SQFCTTVEMTYGKMSLCTSDSYSTLSAYFASTRKLKLATEYAGRSLVIRIRHLGAKNAATADSHFNLALLFRLQTEFPEARQHFSYALAIREEVEGEGSLSVASTRMALGKTCELMGGSEEEAFAHYSKALATFRSLLGNEDPASLKASEAIFRVRTATTFQEGGSSLETTSATMMFNSEDLRLALSNISSSSGTTVE
ncbi:hypothetical protein TrRE_jg11302, partial [Triparma retinervis]